MSPCICASTQGTVPHHSCSHGKRSTGISNMSPPRDQTIHYSSGSWKLTSCWTPVASLHNNLSDCTQPTTCEPPLPPHVQNQPPTKLLQHVDPTTHLAMNGQHSFILPAWGAVLWHRMKDGVPVDQLHSAFDQLQPDANLSCSLQCVEAEEPLWLSCRCLR